MQQEGPNRVTSDPETDDSYPSAWRPRDLPADRVVDDEIDDYIRSLSAAQLQALLLRTRSGRG